jgi:hypothetical protein
MDIYLDEYSNTVQPVTALHLPHNGHLSPTSDRQKDYLRIQQKGPLFEFFLQMNPNIGLGAAGYISSGKIFKFFNPEFLRPFNFLFQIARGSEATLSECTFLRKSIHHSRIFSEKTTSRFLFERTRTRLASPSKT